MRELDAYVCDDDDAYFSAKYSLEKNRVGKFKACLQKGTK